MTGSPLGVSSVFTWATANDANDGSKQSSNSTGKCKRVIWFRWCPNLKIFSACLSVLCVSAVNLRAKP